MQSGADLIAEYMRIRDGHRKAMRSYASLVLGPSVLRVFVPGTQERVAPVLTTVNVDRLPRLRGQGSFRHWFEDELERVAEAIRETNADNPRVNPGYKWGHATKILALYVRAMVLNSRYFTDAAVERISPWLYVPVDGVIMQRLRTLGWDLPFWRIKQIDKPEKFYLVQDALGKAAASVGVPRVWFDDNWGEFR